jgi:RNA polymerase sigma factor (sigma-70 family)
MIDMRVADTAEDRDSRSLLVVDGALASPDYLVRLRARLERAAPEVHQFVAHRVPNFADAEDIAQETMLIACAKLSTFRGGDFQAWLLTIARHRIIDHYRAQRRSPFVDQDRAEEMESEEALHSPHASVCDTCHHRARLQCHLNCIRRRLGLAQQVAVMLADIYGHRDKDSAAFMALSVPSFKLLLHKARVGLQEGAGGFCALVRQGFATCAPCAEGPREPVHDPAQLGEAESSSLLTLRDELRRQLGIT